MLLGKVCFGNHHHTSRILIQTMDNSRTLHSPIPGRVWQWAKRAFTSVPLDDQGRVDYQTSWFVYNHQGVIFVKDIWGISSGGGLGAGHLGFLGYAIACTIAFGGANFAINLHAALFNQLLDTRQTGRVIVGQDSGRCASEVASLQENR